MRNPHDEALALRLNKDLLARVRAAAKTRGVSVSDATREAMNLWLMSEPATQDLVVAMANESDLFTVGYRLAGENRARQLVLLSDVMIPLAEKHVESSEAAVAKAEQEVASAEVNLAEAEHDLEIEASDLKTAREWLRRLNELTEAIGLTQNADDVENARSWLDEWKAGIRRRVPEAEVSE